MNGCAGRPCTGRMWDVFGPVLAVLVALAAPAAFAAATFSVDAGVPANVGDVAEVGISLDYDGTAPTVAFVFVAFDNARLAPAEDYYETVPVDANGNPIRDGDGNVQAVLSAVWAAPEVSDAGKTVTVEYYDAFDDNAARGGVGIAIAGINSEPLPKGAVLKVALRVLSNNQSNAVIPVLGVDALHPVILDGRPTASSASSVTGESVGLTVVNGSVALGCTRPAAPANVSASQDQKNSVTIAWDGAEGLEYRVFRSTEADPLSAQALGEGWTTENVFDDVTASSPTVLTAPGCFRKGVYEDVPYYYWVKSRDLESGCESDASSPAVQGWRSAAKSMVAAAAWPPRDPAAWLVPAAAMAFLALRARRKRHAV